MSLEKGIEHGKEHRRQYYKTCYLVDKECRCGGSCLWCRSNRTIQIQKENEKTLDKMKDEGYN